MSGGSLGAAMIGAGVVATALAATAAPLLVYSLSLAAFGLPHVLVELRYVDARFHRRLGTGRLLVALLSLLLAVAALRLAGIAGAELPVSSMAVELWIVIALAATVLPLLRGTALVLGVATIAALAIGVTTAPLTTLVLLACLHNLTPVGFIAEATRGRARRLSMVVCGLVFAVVPALILTGAPGAIAAHLDLLHIDLSLLDIGTWRDHAGVFVPPLVDDDATAVRWFSAVAYLQCMHYAAVIHVLPRLLDRGHGEPATLLAWPRERIFALVVAGLGFLFLLGFAAAFVQTRAIYGVFAAIHAWIELPVLLLAAAGATVGQRSPRPST